MLALLLVPTVSFAASTTVFSAKADLNGDGRPDKIQVLSNAGKPLQAIQVSIAGILQSDTQLYRTVTARVIDLDKTDKKQEVLVDGVADDGNHWFTVFGFDGRKVLQLVKASTLSATATADATGTGDLVLTSPEGYFVRHSAYRIGLNKLDAVPQPYAYVNAEATASDAVQLFDEPNGGNVIATIPAGGTARIVLVQTAQPWWLVVAPDGLTGWVGKDFIPKILVPKPLSAADAPPADAATPPK